MIRLRTSLNGFAVAALFVFTASRADAQATRTWVSGVGDDANPCSRTAPCKTFAGAISKTAAAGEINAIDPGGFGAVTITKSITIDPAEVEGGIVAAGTNGIIINALATDTVILRNLDINGVNTGLIGIRILAAGRVYIENCRIYEFGAGSARGISDERTSGLLFVSDSLVRANGQSGIVTLGGVQSTLSNVRLQRNGNAGLAVTGGGKATVTNSVASGNVGAGFFVDSAGAELNIAHSSSNSNGQGIRSDTSGTARISDVTIVNNTTGLSTAGGSVLSYGNNAINGNGAGNGPPTGPLDLQ